VGLVIADPADGPGQRSDARYVSALRQTRRQGIRVLGYATTDYGNRSLAEVKSDVDRWHTWYAIDGIFFDEVPSSRERVAYCLELHAYTKSKSGRDHLVVLNPGTQIPQDFMTACDILVNSESSWSTYRDSFPGNPGWVAEYPASRFWHLIHGCPTDAEMQTALKLARARNAEWIFVTDCTDANPYRRLPGTAYWENQLRFASMPLQ
jgi:hypothetical protein